MRAGQVKLILVGLSAHQWLRHRGLGMMRWGGGSAGQIIRFDPGGFERRMRADTKWRVFRLRHDQTRIRSRSGVAFSPGFCSVGRGGYVPVGRGQVSSGTNALDEMARCFIAGHSAPWVAMRGYGLTGL